MPCPIRTTVSVAKFVGTISLGLLTGLSFSLSTVYPQTLLSLPTAPSARSAHRTLLNTARKHITTLTRVSTFSFITAFLVSPRRRKHPYLLYTALLTYVGGVGIDYAATRGWLEKPLRYMKRNSLDVEAIREVEVSEGEDEEVLLGQGGEEVNGEVVRRKVEGMKAREGIRARVLGLGFALGLLGLWGDGA